MLVRRFTVFTLSGSNKVPVGSCPVPLPPPCSGPSPPWRELTDQRGESMIVEEAETVVHAPAPPSTPVLAGGSISPGSSCSCYSLEAALSRTTCIFSSSIRCLATFFISCIHISTPPLPPTGCLVTLTSFRPPGPEHARGDALCLSPPPPSRVRDNIGLLFNI